MCFMGHMERVYVGPSEPKGPYKPTLWIKNDNVGNMAIYIRVGGSYVKFNQGGSDDETLYITATFLPEEQQTGTLLFTIDKTKAEIDDAVAHNKSIIFVIKDPNIQDQCIQCANFHVADNVDKRTYVFEYTQFPMFSPSTFMYFLFSFNMDGTNFESGMFSDGIPEINVADSGTALNYQKYSGGFLSVNVDDTTIGINENNQIYLK